MIGFSRRFQRIFFTALGGIVLQYFIVYYCWTLFSCKSSCLHTEENFVSTGKISCIFQDFNSEYHDLLSGLSSFAPVNIIRDLIVVSHRKLYPPLNYKYKKLRYLEFHPDLSKHQTFLPKNIEAEWVLLIPDAVYFESPQFRFEDYLIEAEKTSANVKIWAFKVRGKRASCYTVSMDYRRWTLELNSSSASICDAISGTLVYLMRTSDYLSLPDPFALPIAESLLLQSIPLGWKSRLFDQTPFSRSNFLLDPQVISHHLQRREEQLRVLYEKFDVKKVVTNRNAETFGCSKTTSRCFGNIFNETPSYLYEGRWLPPCCARALKNTLEHVVEIFNFNEVRYWLEGGSLLGAARNGHLIDWDYDVDLGIYLNDTDKVQFLQAAVQGPVVDPQGFVWEMSQIHEGKFFRVHYSRTNRMHVDIFPFYPSNGVMTKDFWFKTHPQDKEFSEKFLKPISTISFMDIDVPAPNNVKEFLELKFGEGCIETLKYPSGYVT